MADTVSAGDAETQASLEVRFPFLQRAKAEGFVYRVYKSREEYTDVTAHTAADALSKSAVSNPVKIEHLHARLPDILDFPALRGDG